MRIAIAAVSVLSLALGAAVTLFIDGHRIAQEEKQIQRYRVALGIDKATKDALLEMSTQELTFASMNIVAKLRAVCSSYEVQEDKIVALQLDGRLDDKTASDQSARLLEDTNYEFNRTLAADAFAIDSELRRRLGPAGVQTARHGGDFDAVRLVGSPTQLPPGFVCELADEVEQMSNLIPKG